MFAIVQEANKEVSNKINKFQLLLGLITLDIFKHAHTHHSLQLKYAFNYSFTKCAKHVRQTPVALIGDSVARLFA